jgi:valyl-tRNA synthetase
VQLEQTIDTEEERQRLNKDLAYYQGFIQSVQKKLSNEKFVNGAPANVIEMERKKLADSEAKIRSLEEALANLN